LRGTGDPTSQLGALNSYGQFEEGGGAEDLVLAVVAKQRRLSAGIFAVQNNGRYYLPVATLSQIFGFYYDYDSAGRFIEGSGLRDVDAFSIDAGKGVLRFRGERVDLPSEAVLDQSIADDDLYVSIDVLNEIWPMQMNVNLSGLVLKVIPDGKLPYELIDQRKIARERSLLSRENKLSRIESEDFPLVPYPYQLWSDPSVDLSTSFGYRAETDSAVGSLAASGVHDFLFATADYSILAEHNDGEYRPPENFRFRLRRQNAYDGALPFGLEDTQLGDVNLRNRDLISSSSSGRGFIFSTEERNKTGEFDSVDVDGVSVPGWEAELYLNNELIDFQRVSDDGEYRFEDIRIGYGNNRFRVVLYGPQGQIRERVENYLYQSSMVKAGEYVFSGGVMEEGKNLFPIEERRSNRDEGLAANLYAARGINSKLTLFGSGNVVPDQIGGKDVSQQYVSAGAIGSLWNTLGQVEAYKQIDGGEAIDVRTLSDFFGFKVNGQVSAFRDFESPDAGIGDNAKTLETDLSVKKIFSTLVGALGLEVRRNHLRRESSVDTTRYVTRQSLGVRGVRTTNTTTTVLSDGDHQTTNGNLSVTSRYNRWNLRNTIGYAVHPDVEAQLFQTELRYGRPRDWSTAITANYNFLTDAKRLSWQITKDFQKYLGSLETSWTSTGGFGFLARMSTALGPYGPEGSYIARSQPLLNTGAVESLVYNDVDGDGAFSEGDEAVQDARVSVGRRTSRVLTDEEGTSSEFVSAVGSPVNVKVVEASVDNPYLIAKDAGFKIFPRPGIVQKLAFPLVETGAIDGTLRWSQEGKPIAGVKLQILDDNGEVVQETQTAVDGYYTFEQIPPGNYTIRPASETGLDIEPKYVDISADNLFQFGTDISSDGAGPSDALDGLNFENNTQLSDDGTLNVQNIISLAKGYKGKSGFQNANVNNNAQAPARLQNASMTNNQSSQAQAFVKSVRIGDHPNKIGQWS